jgi:large subunit ribosomal protein L30
MAEKKVRVTKIKSAIGRQSVQKKTLEALGLGKISSSRIHNDTPQLRGMIFRVKHLVAVQEVAE